MNDLKIQINADNNTITRSISIFFKYNSNTYIDIVVYLSAPDDTTKLTVLVSILQSNKHQENVEYKVSLDLNDLPKKINIPGSKKHLYLEYRNVHRHSGLEKHLIIKKKK